MNLQDIYRLPLEQRAIGPILRLRAELDGARNYLTTPDATFTFAQANELSRAVARGLVARGIGPSAGGGHVTDDSGEK